MVPVLTPAEASALDPSESELPVPHPHVVASSTATPSVDDQEMPLSPGRHSKEILMEMGLTDDELKALVSDGAVEEFVQSKM